MKNILCFGDSNTFGLKPDGTGRYSYDMRYPGILQGLLGDGYRVIEEGCPGRTTVYEDIDRPFKKGIDYFIPCLLSHIPLEFVIIMLGTNDCKAAYKATANEIAFGMSQYIKAVRDILKYQAQIIIVAPAHLGTNIWLPSYDPEFNEESVRVSKELAYEYKKLSQKSGCMFLDAADFTSVSKTDQEHLDENGHSALANAVAKIISITNILN